MPDVRSRTPPPRPPLPHLARSLPPFSAAATAAALPSSSAPPHTFSATAHQPALASVSASPSKTLSPSPSHHYHPYGFKSTASSLLTRTCSSPAQPVDLDVYRQHRPSRSLSNHSSPIQESGPGSDADTPTRPATRRSSTASVSSNTSTRPAVDEAGQLRQKGAPQGGDAVRALAQQIERKLSEVSAKPLPNRAQSTGGANPAVPPPQVAVPSDPTGVHQEATPLFVLPDETGPVPGPLLPSDSEAEELVVFQAGEEDGVPTLRAHTYRPSNPYFPSPSASATPTSPDKAGAGLPQQHPLDTDDFAPPQGRAYKRGTPEYAALLARLAQLEDRLTEVELEQNAERPAAPSVFSDVLSLTGGWRAGRAREPSMLSISQAGYGDGDWADGILGRLGLNVGEPPKRKRDLPAFLFLAGVGVGVAVSKVLFSRGR